MRKVATVTLITPASWVIDLPVRISWDLSPQVHISYPERCTDIGIAEDLESEVPGQSGLIEERVENII